MRRTVIPWAILGVLLTLTPAAAQPGAGSNASPAVRVATVRAGDVYGHDLARGNETRVTNDGANGDLWWSGDGSTLFFVKGRATGPRELWRWRAESGAQPAGGSPRPEDWAPQGDRAAVMEPQTGRWQPDPAWMETRVALVEAGVRRPITPHEPGVRWEPLAWSPDGTRLALLRLTFGQSAAVQGTFTAVADVSLWLAAGDLDAPSLRRIPLPAPPGFNGQLGVPDAVLWSPDGRFLALGIGPAMPCASCRADGSLWQVVSVESGATVELGGALTRGGALAWARDGSFLAISTPGGRETYRRKQIVRVDPVTGARLDLSNDTMWADTQPAVSPTGGAVAFVRGPDNSQGGISNVDAIAGRRIWLMRADGSDQHQLTEAPGWTDEAPAWTADGAWLVFVRWRAGGAEPPAAQLWAVRPDGSDAHALVPELEPPNGLADGFGFYGAFAWRGLYAVAPAPERASALPGSGTGLAADARGHPMTLLLLAALVVAGALPGSWRRARERAG